MSNLFAFLKPYQSNALVIYCLQMFIVLSGTTLGLFYAGLHQFIVPITLGAIAASLTDFDDRLSIRLRNFAYVSVLFFVTSTILEALAPYKFWFIVYLAASSVLLVLSGALGQRYATISFGTILLSIYTMFGLGEYTPWYFQPLCFMVGAIWYSLSSIIFYLLKPTLAVQDNLSRTFFNIAQLLTEKSKLFDPDNSIHTEKLLFELSLKSAAVVQCLNTSKASLLTRLKASRANKHTIYWLHLYFLAQDIHEKALSTYLHYEQVQHNFSRSDLIFRIQKNVKFLARACQDLSECILQRKAYEPRTEDRFALEQLESSMQDWIAQHPSNLEVRNLHLILKNLYNFHEQLASLNNLQKQAPALISKTNDNFNLLDDDVQDWHDFVLKFKTHLSPQSALFRHAIRIAIIFIVGYAVSLLPFSQNGYWILLTGLFVCQSSYFATKSRLKMRTLGTLLGVLLGIPILYFVPSVEGQLMLTVICGVYFYYLRVKKYSIATLMATLMVLLIFNMKGAGYAIILPRIIDTLLGCGIAWLAVSFIWPDWNFRNISKNIENNTQATMNYLNEVVQQYQQGKNNSMAYRLARRNAHNKQTELANMISSLSTEPHPNPNLIHNAFRYLVYSHSQLSYISALGVHRNYVKDPQILAFMQWCQTMLNAILLQHQALPEVEIQNKLLEIQQLSVQPNLSDEVLLILKQISLLLETLPELLNLSQQLLQQEIR
ncbi:YccS family putative transporter [Acinetobacter sp. MD2(2019)]|uniref:YccS family putative transporter n=1 Tax=Acinetobacter sp. MD2(2019) TaxID=2605273 RepID=UPI002D1F4BE9|nr:YccS family putative transporter [Acinetobacter sp. MD2(2019)]MEB3753268.1 TIGR01666 family membrane protein [Acinetobacter sp. MD2(2019)]